jgi:hypothetical protein
MPIFLTLNEDILVVCQALKSQKENGLTLQHLRQNAMNSSFLDDENEFIAVS